MVKESPHTHTYTFRSPRFKMADDEDTEQFGPPSNLNTLSVPNEPELRAAYATYRSSPATQRLQSERKRTLYADAFNDTVDTLAQLCVRAIAKYGARRIPSAVLDDPSKLRIFYDSLDIELPLEDCYAVEDQHYWRRVVLAKTRNNSLRLKKINEHDWRSEGISLKYVELVEACPVRNWPAEKMAHLGQLVREQMHSLHIRHLQSLTDLAFKHHIESVSELDITSDEPESYEISSDER